jgi:hypothetical protein
VLHWQLSRHSDPINPATPPMVFRPWLAGVQVKGFHAQMTGV